LLATVIPSALRFQRLLLLLLLLLLLEGRVASEA